MQNYLAINVVDLTIHAIFLRTSFAIATHFRKRSEYRRPSQMGVPNASFQQKQSEFLSHQPQRPKLFKAANQRPSNMLGGSQEGNEASKETFISESKRSYEDRTATALKGAKAQQSRPKSNLKAEIGGNDDLSQAKSINR